MKYLVIEHPTRGMFTEMGYDVVTGTPKPHFSVQAGRSDERVERFPNLRSAQVALSRFSERLRRECYVMQSPGDLPRRDAYDAMSPGQRAVAVAWRKVYPTTTN